MDCTNCNIKSRQCANCKTVNYYFKKIEKKVMDMITLMHTMHDSLQRNGQELNMTKEEIEFIFKNYEKAEVRLNISNVLIREKIKNLAKEEVPSSSCADWIE